MTRPRVLVYAGPSLAGESVSLPSGWEWRPPVRMGDLYYAHDASLKGVLILDGVFHGEPSVWHREILDLMSSGVHVAGAASMGALRAAELCQYGMVGVGEIYAWYRDGVVDGDDEVALLHFPAELGYVAASEPLVNLRATIAAATSAGACTDEEAFVVLAAQQAREFRERQREDWTSDACASLGPTRGAAVGAALRAHYVDAKRRDAHEALRQFASVLHGLPPSVVPRYVAPRWELDRRLRQRAGNGVAADRIPALKADAERVTRVTRAAFARIAAPDTHPDAVSDAQLADWAEHEGITLPMGSLAEQIAWLVAQGPRAAGYEWELEVALLDTSAPSE